PRIRRTIPPPSRDDRSLPRFELPLDSSEVIATSKRPSISAVRPYRPVRRRVDSTADVAVEDILLEAYLDEPKSVTLPSAGVAPREDSVEVFRRASFGVPPSAVASYEPP